MKYFYKFIIILDILAILYTIIMLTCSAYMGVPMQEINPYYDPTWWILLFSVGMYSDMKRRSWQ